MGKAGNTDPVAGGGSSRTRPDPEPSEPSPSPTPEPAPVDELPLADVRVLDLTRLLPGGFCTQLLADFGADVIKVEDTGAGDYVRWAPPLYGEEDQGAPGTRSALYLSLNRNKRAIRLDLKQEAGRRALLRLVADADVLVEGFRPGVMERLGLGYETLHEANPALVYCAITGYGQDGPLADRAGHDQNYLALNGILGLSGQADGPPTMAGVQIADLAGGALPAAFGIMAALHQARRSGEGQMVDISMTDASLSLLAMVAGKYLCDGIKPRRGREALNGGFVCYMPYEAADGWVSCAALEPKFWGAFCAGVDRPDLIERQYDPPGSETWRQVAEIFAGRSRDEWARFNAEHDCCIEPVLDLDEVLESELVEQRRMVVGWEQPGAGPVRQLASPVKLTRTPATLRRPAPGLGEHTAEVLAEAGFSAEEIEALLASGAAAGEPESGETGGAGFRA